MSNYIDHSDNAWNRVLGQSLARQATQFSPDRALVLGVCDDDVRRHQLPDQRAALAVHADIDDARDFAQDLLNISGQNLTSADVDDIGLPSP